MTEIVAACLSQFHDDENSFELLVNFADGREIGHLVTRASAKRIAAEFAREFDTPPPVEIVMGSDADLLAALKLIVSSCTSSPTPMSEGQTRIVTAPSRDALVMAQAAIAKADAAAAELSVGWGAEEKLTVEEAWTILCETSDITSPEEYPDHALITMEQLGSFMARAIEPQWIPADQAPRGSYGLIRHRSGLIDVVYKTNNGEPFLETWRYAGTARGGEQAPWPDAFMPLDRAVSTEVER